MTLKRAKDVMRTNVISIPEDTDLWALARLFLEHGITGTPVVDKNGELVGVVSQTDILRYLKERALPVSAGNGFYEEPEPDGDRPGGVRVTAGELMSRTVIEAGEDATVHELSGIMLRRRVHRVIITRGRRIAGIVTTMDLLKVL